MKKKTTLLIIGLTLVLVSTIALPTLHLPHSLWQAIKAGTQMEPGATLP